MVELNLLELFSGTESISTVAKELGYKTFTSDFDEQFNSDYCIDIMDFDIKKVPFKPDIIWASPPCTTFSIAAISHHWNNVGSVLSPKSKDAKRGVQILRKTITIIDILMPKYWYIENPVGLMRKMEFMKNVPRATITYCQYGDTRMKPTDIWTNNQEWIPRQMCKNGMNCHESAPRGSRTGTQGLGNAIDRAKIPEGLCYEILLNVNRNTVLNLSI